MSRQLTPLDVNVGTGILNITIGGLVGFTVFTAIGIAVSTFGIVLCLLFLFKDA